MSGSSYISGTNHSATLETAMTTFHRALTRRWRKEVCAAIVADSHDYPTRFRRAVSPHSSQPLWEYWSIPARNHFGARGGCAFVAWVNGGQQGALSAVTCDGATGIRQGEDVTVPDIRVGEVVHIPPYIHCGMGSILAQVEDWAWGERDQVFYQLPLFDGQNVGALHNAHDAFIRAGGTLSLEADPGSNADVSGTFSPMSQREIPSVVTLISSNDSDGQDWWAGWTGLAASRAGAGFFASVKPTLNNQSGILGSLANLYSDRAAIIEKGRNDALYWIKWATESLDETEVITTDSGNGWKAVQGIGNAVSIGGAWNPKAAAAGAALTLVGFLGENIDSGTTREALKYEMAEVVGGLNDKISGLNSALDGYELDYRSAVTRLQTQIHGIHSYNLELYDLMQNEPGGDAGTARDDGYHVEVDSVLRLAEHCYQVGESYEQLLSIVRNTSQADRHLADKDGAQTTGDVSLLEVRDQLESFLKTSCSRYFVAGNQVKEAAEEYVAVDTSQKGRFERTIEDWDSQGVGEHDLGFNPDTGAEETDRSGFDPYADHPALGGGEPGAADGEDYVTERR